MFLWVCIGIIVVTTALQIGVRYGLLKVPGVLKIFNALGMVRMPDRIALNPVQVQNWLPKWVTAHQSLEVLGFAWVGTFAIQPTGGAMMVHMLMPPGIYAVTYDFKGRIWTDLFGDFSETETLTVTNPDRDPQTPTRPGKQTIVRVGASVEELHRTFLETVAGRPLKPITAEGFGPRFCRAYEESMKFLKGH